jgi:hypothetical protein
MSRAWLVALAACGRLNGGDDAVGADGGDPAACEAQFDLAIKSLKDCSTDGECSLLIHDPGADCCNTVMIGVAGTNGPQASGPESQYETCQHAACAGRTCPAPQQQAEDGTVPDPMQTIVAVCSNLRCTSTVR